MPSLTKEPIHEPKNPERGAKQHDGHGDFSGENRRVDGANIRPGDTEHMHGKSKGGHPSIRAQEFKKGDKGEGHHIHFGKNNEHKYGNQ
jgi:hypothetical protein